MNVFSKLTVILSEFNAFGVPIESHTRIIDDLGLDSLTIVEFLTRLEIEFHIKISDAEIKVKNFGTVEAIVHYLECKMKEAQ